jgi:transcription elongation factor Elf1
MADISGESSEIKDTDIVFDCPHCGKSLAIDYRGAGLTIPCTDCGKNVQVPIPDGMEISDIDNSAEDQEIRILNLRRSLSAAELKIERLSVEIDSMTIRRESLEKTRMSNMGKFSQVLERVSALQKLQEDSLKQMQKIVEICKEEA